MAMAQRKRKAEGGLQREVDENVWSKKIKLLPSRALSTSTAVKSSIALEEKAIAVR